MTPEKVRNFNILDYSDDYSENSVFNITFK